MKVKGLSPMIGAFLGLMVAVVIGMSVVIPTIQTTVDTATQLATATETNIASVNGTTTALANYNLVAGSLTAVINGVTLTTPANYTVSLGTANTKGSIAWVAANDPALVVANVTYQYYPSTYISSGTVITLLNLLPLLLVLLILIGAVALVKI